jgi:hypothetical protein
VIQAGNLLANFSRKILYLEISEVHNKEYGLLSCNTVWFGKSPKFQRNTSSLSPVLRNKLSKKPSRSRMQAELSRAWSSGFNVV